MFLSSVVPAGVPSLIPGLVAGCRGRRVEDDPVAVAEWLELVGNAPEAPGSMSVLTRSVFVPSVCHSSRAGAGQDRREINMVAGCVKPWGNESAAPTRMSSTRDVPAAVPSVRQSSDPSGALVRREVRQVPQHLEAKRVGRARARVDVDFLRAGGGAVGGPQLGPAYGFARAEDDPVAEPRQFLGVGAVGGAGIDVSQLRRAGCRAVTPPELSVVVGAFGAERRGWRRALSGLPARRRWRPGRCWPPAWCLQPCRRSGRARSRGQGFDWASK